MFHLKEKIKYHNILGQSVNQNFKKTKHNMENISENDILL